MRIPTLALLLFGCSSRTPQPPPPVAAEKADDPRWAGVTDPRLQALLAEHWDAQMQRYPSWATRLGDRRFDGAAFDSTAAAEAAWTARQQDWVTRLSALDPLQPDDARTRDLLVGDLQGEMAQEACTYSTWSFSPRRNPMLDGNEEAQHFPLATPADGEALIRRLAAMARDVDVQRTRLAGGLAKGFVANRPSTELVLEQARAQLALPLADSPITAPLQRMPADWSDADRERFSTAYTEAARTWTAALERWVGFLETDVLPAARTDAEGLIGIPTGTACYEAMIRHHTTLPLTADAIHQTGLDEIARLHEEMASLGRRALGTPDIPTLFERLRTDPELYFTTEEEVEAKAVEALARAKAAIPAWFGRLPASDCVVERVPPYEAPYTTIAYYRQVVPGERPGVYAVNTYQPETRPRHEAEVLAFHESIPGHHLQIALAREQGALPTFRRNLGVTAFVEGWGLYSEQLADEMGLYTSDVDRLGMYSFELWRASRLVVDTGLHSKGWSRQQAVDFMLANTPLAENNIVNEVDRYITTPGQALAYKIGQLEIWRLRRDAETRLGDRFDIKAFHDVVLGSGAVSLPLLQAQVEAWVASLE
jgi:uncharacterized protein (DUF885 family)